MNDEQRIAYEWAKKQNYTSVAAQFAKLLTGVIDNLQADYDNEQILCAEILVENSQLRSVITQIDPNFFTRKCRICGCDWNHPCECGCSWVEDDLCSTCADQGLGGEC